MSWFYFDSLALPPAPSEQRAPSGAVGYRDDEICWAALETAEYVDKDGIPTAPKDMKAARKRPDRKMWEDARLKEEQGLHDRGVFEYLTYDELRDRGVVGGRYALSLHCTERGGLCEPLWPRTRLTPEAIAAARRAPA